MHFSVITGERLGRDEATASSRTLYAVLPGEDHLISVLSVILLSPLSELRQLALFLSK